MESMASRSSSFSVNNSGRTVTEFPSGLYALRIVDKEERETYTMMGGGRTPSSLLQPNHAASHGRVPAPPSPK